EDRLHICLQNVAGGELSDADHLQPLTVIPRMPRPPVGMAWPSASSRAERSTLGALLDQPFIAVRIDLRWGFCRDRTSSLLQAALRLAAACKMEEILFGAGYPGWRSRTRSELGYLISARWASGYTTADSFIEGPKSRFAGRTRLARLQSRSEKYCRNVSRPPPCSPDNLAGRRKRTALLVCLTWA